MGAVYKVLEKKEKAIVAVSPDAVVFDAISKMNEKGVGTALVMDGTELTGIFSERDFIRKVYLKNTCGQTVQVRDVMTTRLTTVTPDDSLEKCMNMMTEKKIRHLPVLKAGQVVGIVSIGDIVKFMVTEKDFLIKNLENYISGPGM